MCSAIYWFCLLQTRVYFWHLYCLKMLKQALWALWFCRVVLLLLTSVWVTGGTQTKCLVMLPYVLKTSSHRPAIYWDMEEEIKMSFPLFIKGPWPSSRLGQYSKHHAAESPEFKTMIQCDYIFHKGCRTAVFFHCVLKEISSLNHQLWEEKEERKPM